MSATDYDVIVVGAGVVGSLIARALSRYRLRTLLIDKAADVGEGATKANTAIVHAGYDALPGTLKAGLNVAGNAMFDRVCSELDVEFDRCGTYVVALGDRDLTTLHELHRRGMANGVTGLSLIDGQEMRRREPAITEEAVGALHAATGGLVDTFGLCIAAAENAVTNGVTLRLETEALDFLREGDCIRGLLTNRGTFRSRWVVIAAGLWADDLMRKAGLDSYHITPRKGEYFVLDRVAAEQVHNILFPCPTPLSKGILVTPTIHGNVLLGPNANDIQAKGDLSVTAPGLAASPAIAEYVVSLLAEAGLDLVPRPDYDPIRAGIPRFSRLTRKEQETLIAQDPRYGNVVCRCETVTEGEIVAACHAPIPACTYDALKRRTRIGTGRCQGGFDTPLVIEIMARELGLSPLEITKKGGDSRFLLRKTKEVAG